MDMINPFLITDRIIIPAPVRLIAEVVILFIIEEIIIVPAQLILAGVG